MSRILLAFLCIAVLSLALWGWILYRGRQWREYAPGQRTIVIMHPAKSEVLTPLSLAIWRPDSQELLVLPLPENLRFRWSVNGESFPVWALPRLAAIEEWTPEQWHRELSLQFGVVVDGTITVKMTQDALAPATVITESRQAVLGARETSLQRWDALSWWQGVRATDTLRRETLPFENGWMNTEQQLNIATYDRFARLRFQDEAVRNSNWGLRVVNASGVSGEAARYARVLELIGYRVFALETQSDPAPSRLSIFSAPDTSDLDGQWASERLQTLFGDWEIQVDPTQAEQQRTEGELILGQ